MPNAMEQNTMPSMYVSYAPAHPSDSPWNARSGGARLTHLGLGTACVRVVSSAGRASSGMSVEISCETESTCSGVFLLLLRR